MSHVWMGGFRALVGRIAEASVGWDDTRRGAEPAWRKRGAEKVVRPWKSCAGTRKATGDRSGLQRRGRGLRRRGGECVVLGSGFEELRLREG